MSSERDSENTDTELLNVTLRRKTGFDIYYVSWLSDEEFPNSEDNLFSGYHPSGIIPRIDLNLNK